MANPRLNIPIGGPEYEPAAASYRPAPVSRRREYWRLLGEYALTVKRDEVRRGIDVDGRRLRRTVRQDTDEGYDVFYPLAGGRTGHYYQAAKGGTRPEDGDGPPLIPHYGESRTQRLLALHVMATGFTIYWKPDAGKSWKTILGYHAEGNPHLPVRDVIGISPAGLKKIKAMRATLWRRLAGDEPKPKPTPKPPPRTPARPAPEPVRRLPPPAPPVAAKPPRVVHLPGAPRGFGRNITVYDPTRPEARPRRRD